MCGRVRLSSDYSEIKIRLQFAPDSVPPNFEASWNKPPTEPMLVAIRSQDGKLLSQAAGGKMNDQIKLTVDMRDWSSESWLCVDCGFNTAPGFLSRAERQKAFKANGRRIQETIDSNSEVYTVRDSVWQRTGLEPGGGCLCISCLEKRLCRRLNSEDFDHYDPYNDPSLPGTRRLLDRRGKPKGR
jgi:hypothetical protein